MTDFRIRDARPEERPEIRELTLAAYEQYAPAMDPQFWQGYRENIVETLADVGSAEQIIAEQDGRIAGSILLYHEQTTVDLADETSIRLPLCGMRLLAVAPDKRKQGIGKALVFECIRRARNVGATAITLHTMDVMQAAMKLYESIGFRRDPETDWAPTPGFIVKGYRMDLAPIR